MSEDGSGAGGYIDYSAVGGRRDADETTATSSNYGGSGIGRSGSGKGAGGKRTLRGMAAGGGPRAGGSGERDIGDHEMEEVRTNTEDGSAPRSRGGSRRSSRHVVPDSSDDGTSTERGGPRSDPDEEHFDYTDERKKGAQDSDLGTTSSQYDAPRGGPANFEDAIIADPLDQGHFLNDHIIPHYGNPTLLTRLLLEVKQAASFGIIALSFGIYIVIALTVYVSHCILPTYKWPKRAKTDKEWWNRITGERYSGRLEYYAEYWGYECEQHDVETEDGFVLRIHHLLSSKHRVRGHPVLLQHGILCNSVNFVLNEERSMAFWLLEQGYDVWLSNIRTNFKQPHRRFTRWDPRYWNWAFKEIGLYDCYAAVSYVYDVTGSKVAYVGHSQGAGTMFLCLSRGCRPDLSEKMSCFIAMGPAVYAGEVLKTFPFSLMRMFTARNVWQLIFGVREFIPFLSLTQEYLPGWLFGYLAYAVFHQLFNFTDANWVPRQIPKFFRSTPMPNSSELLFFYMGNFSHRECIFDESSGEHWFPKSFPPLAIFWGTTDTLVAGAPLVERCRKHEPLLDLHRVVTLEGYEHLDMLWHVNAIHDVFIPMREVIEETRVKELA